MNRVRTGLLGLSFTALFAALIAAGAFVSIPVPLSPVPIVLQNFFAVLAGLVLGPLWGGTAAALYLAAGALGAPIFAGFSGGPGSFMGPTGGFLVGYFLAALTAGGIAGRPRLPRRTPFWRVILASIAGFIFVYVPGIPWLKYILNVDWYKALALGLFPFVIGDAVKAAAAVCIALGMRRLVRDIFDR
ncbi:MAG: biotin transporter BioY [Treponema sp.]|jgi:biotin transport system substrate-specific component|nr:biotin transporter BioY [Treponema sp.]